VEWRITGPDQQVLTKAEVVAYLKFRSEKALDAKIARGQFPRGTALGRRGPVVWSGLDLACWLHLSARLIEGPAGEDGEEDERE
jgi:predicted DNA-binding transcriptional regulator AlpA